MKIGKIMIAAGMLAAALGASASADAQRHGDDRGHGRYDRDDRGRGGYDRGDRGRHNGWDRHHQRCRVEWRHHHRVRICR